MIEHSYADVNGVNLHYAHCGQGPLIMFLHGFPEYWDMWKEQLEEFGKDHLAVAPDMRGYNLSSKPQEVSQYKQKYLMEDIRLLAEHLGFKKFILGRRGGLDLCHVLSAKPGKAYYCEFPPPGGL